MAKKSRTLTWDNEETYIAYKDLQAKVKRLEEDNAALIRFNTKYSIIRTGLQAKIIRTRFQAKIKRLEEALKRYGHHDSSCSALGEDEECICGFKQALKGR